MAKILLLISDLPDDKVFGEEVAKQAGMAFKCVDSPREGAMVVSKEDVAVIFVDVSTSKQYQAFESAIAETVGLFSERINFNSIHFLSSEHLEKVRYLVQSPLFGHFIVRNYQSAVEAAQHYSRIVKATQSERAFGLNGLLKPGTKIQVIHLKRSTQKQNAVEAVKNFLVAAKYQNRMATVIANAVDELLMNAIFDAPVDEVGRQVYSTTARTAQMELAGQQAVELHVGFDGDYVAITAVDLFGSIDKSKLLTHISKIYTDEEYKVRTSVAGAGIGLATVFRSGGSFFFVSESAARTEVTVFFKKTDNFRQFKDQFRFISTQFYF